MGLTENQDVLWQVGRGNRIYNGGRKTRFGMRKVRKLDLRLRVSLFGLYGACEMGNGGHLRMRGVMICLLMRPQRSMYAVKLRVDGGSEWMMYYYFLTRNRVEIFVCTL
jgi:hypothetical protein